jgi:integrase
VQYRQAGRSRRATIGEHGRLTPDQARSEAKKLLGAVETGSDPIADRHKEKRIVDLRRGDAAKLHVKLADTPYAANRAVALVSAVWNWAARRDEVDANSNPATGIERYREKGRERFLTSGELARLGDALAEGETYAVDETKPGAKHAPKSDKRRVKLDPFAVGAIWLLILTGARLREALHAQWQAVDLERGILFLPDSKTGKKPVLSKRGGPRSARKVASHRRKSAHHRWH